MKAKLTYHLRRNGKWTLSVTFDEVVEYFGGIPAMAERLGIRRQSIYQWEGRIPMGRAYQIQAITEGEIKADDLPTDDEAA